MMMEYDGSVEVDGYENDTDEIKEAFKPSDVKSKKLQAESVELRR